MRWHHRRATERGRPLLVGEFGLPNQELFPEGQHDLSQRRAIYQTWFNDVEQGAAVGALPWLFIPDERPDTWDRYSFRLHDGSDPADLSNRYADLLQQHAARHRRGRSDDQPP